MLIESPPRPVTLGRLSTPVLVTLAIMTLYALAAARLGTVTSRPPLLHWDGFWYQEIARHGYRNLPQVGRQSAAFFPLLPAATHLLTLVLPRVAFAQVALVVPVLSITTTMVLVNGMLGEWPSWQRTATVALLLAIPAAFFYVAFYAESMLVLAEAFTFWCLSRPDRLRLAPLGVVLGTLARPLGVLLLIPVVMVVLEKAEWPVRRRVAVVGASCAGIPILLGTYLLATGNPLEFLAARSHWSFFRSQGYLSALGRSVPRTIDLVVSNATLRPGGEPAIAAGMWALLLATPLALLALRWWRPAGWFALAMVVAVAALGSVESQSRMLLVVLPLWVAPIALYRHLRTTWIVVGLLIPPGLAFNVYLAAQFASSRWAG